MHIGTLFGIKLPALLYDAPQFRAYVEGPIECAMTIVNDVGDAATIMTAVIRSLARTHLVGDTRPRIYICFVVSECGIEQLLWRFVTPSSRCRCVSVIRELTHEIVKRSVGNANLAIVLHQNVGRTKIPMANTLAMEVPDSSSDLRDLIQFVGFRVASVTFNDIPLRVVGNFDCGKGTAVNVDG